MPRAFLLQAARELAAASWEARLFAVRACLAAPAVRASLAFAGLRPTLRWIEAFPPAARRRAPPVGVIEGERLTRGVLRHLVGGECLPQSLLQYLLHRRDGLPVRLVVGVRRRSDAASDIDAHAWVEDAREPPSTEPSFARVMTWPSPTGLGRAPGAG
jgi:hypothetical protein